MASLITKRGKRRWLGAVMIHGKRKNKLFPDNSKVSERDALNWEIATREESETIEIENSQNQSLGYSITDWTNKYLKDVKIRHSMDTFKEKKSAFKRFFNFHKLESNFPVTEISKEMCRDYLDWRYEDMSGNAANKDRKNLSCGWTWGQNNIDEWEALVNTFRSIEKYKEERHPRYVPPEEDFWQVYDYIPDQQDKTMVLAYLHLAIRRSELFRMKRNDLDFQNKRARIWTRKRDAGLEYDWLPMTTELHEALSVWWKKRMEMDDVNSEYVFVCLDDKECTSQYYGKPFTQRRHFMRRSCRRAGVDPTFTFHAIRHLTASILFGKGYSVGHIQLVLRHKSPTTTEKYLRSLGLEMVRDALEEGLTRGEKVVFIEDAKRAIAQKK